jgi:hypothetical protein
MESEIADRLTEIRDSENRNHKQFHPERHSRFGTSSERDPKEQHDFLNETEATAEGGPFEEGIRPAVSMLFDRFKGPAHGRRTGTDD